MDSSIVARHTGTQPCRDGSVAHFQSPNAWPTSRLGVADIGRHRCPLETSQGVAHGHVRLDLLLSHDRPACSAGCPTGSTAGTFWNVLEQKNRIAKTWQPPFSRVRDRGQRRKVGAVPTRMQARHHHHHRQAQAGNGSRLHGAPRPDSTALSTCAGHALPRGKERPPSPVGSAPRRAADRPSACSASRPSRRCAGAARAGPSECAGEAHPAQIRPTPARCPVPC